MELTEDASTFGKALWSGRIVINRELARQEARWRTEIHEALHMFSMGLNPQDYLALRGWEEGVVEQLQRLLRPSLLSALNIAVSEEVFAGVETGHRYNEFISALEDMWVLLHQPSEPFYLHLLATPLKERPNLLIEKGYQLLPKAALRFRRTFAVSFNCLRREPHHGRF